MKKSKKYRDHLESLSNLSISKKQQIITHLLNSCPVAKWPRTMPASIDPKLVLIGVSPGGSQNKDVNEDEFISEPSVHKSEKSNFFYPDKNNYWKKIRLITYRYFNSHEDIKLKDALSLTSHFNLGTKLTGKASKKAVDDEIIKWVSYLLNKVHKPDQLILFGLKNILQDPDKSKQWNHKEGLKINWSSAQRITPLNSYKSVNYKFREWTVTNELKHTFNVTLWPNHPSRPPFSKNFEMWSKAVNEFLS